MFSRSTICSVRPGVLSRWEFSVLAVALGAPVPDPRRCRRLLPGRESGFSAILSGASVAIEIPAPLGRFMFGPSVRSSDLLCPRLTSADPSRRLSATVARWQIGRPPRVRRVTFPLMPAAYTTRPSVQVSDFEDMRLLIQPSRLVCGFCASSQRFACGFLRIPPRGGHPCRPASGSPCRARRGLSPPSQRAMPGAHRVGGGVAPAVLPHHRTYGSVSGGS